VLVGPSLFYPGAGLAEACTKQAAPGNDPPCRISIGLSKIDGQNAAKNIALGDSREPLVFTRSGRAPRRNEICEFTNAHAKAAPLHDCSLQNNL
jgi:hypothetical protein